jgi:hypothetical protein
MVADASVKGKFSLLWFLHVTTCFASTILQHGYGTAWDAVVAFEESLPHDKASLLRSRRLDLEQNLQARRNAFEAKLERKWAMEMENLIRATQVDSVAPETDLFFECSAAVARQLQQSVVASKKASR